MSKGTVAVIGAGALGLAAIKTFSEDGFAVTGYEIRDHVGGLWRNNNDSTLSVHATTIFNSSKFRSAYSDFPFDDSDDDYPTAAQLYAYFQRYAKRFDLLEKIKLGARVVSIVREGEEWVVQVQRISTGEISSASFDKNLGSFEGKVLHSIEFHGAEEFKDQTVLIVGLHATAQDVTNVLSESAKRVYLSHRAGLRLLPRFTEDGGAFDSSVTVTIQLALGFLERTFPRLLSWVLDKALEKESKKAFPDIPEEWGLNPAPSLAVATPLMADTLWPHLQSKFAEPVPQIRRVVGPRSVELSNGRILEDIDSIIYCTGYNYDLPGGLIPKMLDNESLNPYPEGSSGQPPRLYRNIFPLHHDPSICSSLAFLGQGAVVFPGFVQFELISWTISQVFQGNTALPSHENMLKWRTKHLAHRQAKVDYHKPLNNSTFYPSFLNPGDHLPWADEVAGSGLYRNFSVAWFNWRAWKLWWEDKELYYLCTRGIFSPAIWRLFETGKRKAMARDECRRMIVSQNEKVAESKKRKLESKKMA